MPDARDTSLAAAPARLAELVAASARAHAELAELVADGALEGLAAEAAADLATALLRSLDRGQSAAAGLVGRVDAAAGGSTGTLVAGRYASPARWLEAEAGQSRSAAGTTLAMARELRDHAPSVARAWLAGRVRADSVRELTLGVSGALRRLAVPVPEREAVRQEVLARLLPVAERGDHRDVRRALDRLRLVHDPDGAAQAAADAYDDQVLTCTREGAMTRLQAWLTHEAAAAVMTVVEQRAHRIADEERAAQHHPGCPGEADPDTCGCGARAAASTVSKDRWSHLRAVAFGEVMTDLLDNGSVGSHHRVAPHVTVAVDLDDYLRRLGSPDGGSVGLVGELTVPGSDDPVVLPDPTVRRILCDADLTRVLHRTVHPHDGATDDAAEGLRHDAREVLWVGRSERTAPPRLRRALEARDRHCAFPGCRAHARRCHAHHVEHWEDGGTTDPDNVLLLCVRHHHAVHEGGWTVVREGSAPPLQGGTWRFHPPPRRGGPW